jgi:alkylation response protein AidB-like acyl-CoA dehydrogenase
MIGEENAGFGTFSDFPGQPRDSGHVLGCAGRTGSFWIMPAAGQGGRPIVEHQSIGIMLSEIALMIDTLEGYLWDTARHLQNDDEFDVKKTRFGKIYSCDCVVKIMLLGLDILGGSGIMRDHHMEKLVNSWPSSTGTAPLINKR